MKISIQQERLTKALNYVSRAVSAKPNIPVLSNILLVVHEDNLQLSATNLDMGINMWIPGVVSEDGKVTASGKFLADFVSAAGGDKVELYLKSDVLHVHTDTAKAQFQTIAASEFPILPKIEGEPVFTISTVEFITAMEKVLFACATDVTTSKIQLTGALWEIEADSDRVTFVGLNGYRLTKRSAPISLPGDKPLAEPLSIIVPAKSLQESVRIAAGQEVSEIKVFLSKNKSQIICQMEDIEFSIRLLEGPYPDYKAAIPGQYTYAFEASKAEFEKALKVANTFARNTLGSKVSWDLDVETQSLVMQASVADLGNNEVRLPLLKVEAPHDLKDAYSLTYLMEAVHHIEGDTIRFETHAPLLPGVFTDKVDKHFVHVIMPMERED